MLTRLPMRLARKAACSRRSLAPEVFSHVYTEGARPGPRLVSGTDTHKRA